MAAVSPADPLPLVLAAVALAARSAAAAGPTGVEIAPRPDDCPSVAQLRDSLEARLPGVVRERGAGGSPLRLVIGAEEGPSRGPRLDLFDAAGAVVLRRALAPPAPGRADEGCAALADTVALIVARYLTELGYRGPPAAGVVSGTLRGSPTPPAMGSAGRSAAAPDAIGDRVAGLVSVGAGGRVGFGGSQSQPRPELLAGATLVAGGLAFGLSAGVGSQVSTSIPGAPDGRFRLREVPVRAMVGARRPVGGGALLAGAALSVGLLSFTSEGVEGATSRRAVELGGEASVGWVRAVSGPLAVRFGAAAGVIGAPRDFEVGQGRPFYRTPRVYLRLELGAGIAFGKI
jgi:hypothetical protein